MKALNVAVLGCGVVGSQVVRLLTEQAGDLEARVGAPVRLVGVGVRRIDAPRDVEVPDGLLTTDSAALVARDDVDVVVEVIGGIEPARTLILSALENGAGVVTANKALLADDGPTLFEAAEKADRDLFYEAAVAGAIPIVRPLRESLAGDRVTRVIGIVNGTTNYILDKMDSTGAGFEEALEEAQALGYAEADPTADVEGFDAAAKAAILASLAFHSRVTAADVHREGITDVTAADIVSAAEMGSVVKLLAIAELVPLRDGSSSASEPSAGPRAGAGRTSGGEATAGVSVRVHPAMIPRSHPLASVHQAYNAVFVESQAAGQLMFYGPGAGGSPTASAVLGDLVTVARHRLAGIRGAGESAYADRVVLPMGETRTRYHIAVDVDDRAGVLAEIASAFAEEDVSIQTLRQEGRGADAQLVIVTHDATDAQLSRTVESLRGLSCVREVSSVMRVEGTSD
jgi:homoserine dehydrogenase